MTRVAEGGGGEWKRRASTRDRTENGVWATSVGVEDKARLHGVRQRGRTVGAIRNAAAVLSADVHALTVEIHLAVVVHGLGSGYGGGECGAWWGVVIGRVEGGGHGVWVEDVGEGGAVVHHGRANRGEAKVMLKWTSRTYDRIIRHLECVDGEGDLGLRGREGGWLHGLIERVVVQVGLGLGVGGDHDAVDGRDLR